MSIFLKELITKKLKQLTPHEIINYGNKYGFSVTEQEAEDISYYLKSTTFDPFNNHDRTKAFQALARITSIETANKAENLFIQLINSYGLNSLFE